MSEIDTSIAEATTDAQTTGTPTTETSPSATTTTAATSATTPVDGATPPVNAVAPVVPPAYTPNYKYKVNGLQKEFDPLLQKAVTGVEQEQALRKLYEDAHGLTHIKSDRDRLFNEVKEFGTVKTQLAEIGGYLGQKDYGNFFKAFKIPENEVLEWAVQYAQRQQMPPEQKQLYDAQDNAQNQLREVQKQNAFLMEQYRTQLAQTRQIELQSALTADAQVTEFAQTYDARVGQPGAFQMEVVRRGALHYQMTGQDLSPADAVKQTLYASGFSGAQGTPQGNVTQTITQGAGLVQKPPVIPNVQGKASSPTKKSFKSLDDLRKHNQTFN